MKLNKNANTNILIVGLGVLAFGFGTAGGRGGNHSGAILHRLCNQ